MLLIVPVTFQRAIFAAQNDRSKGISMFSRFFWKGKRGNTQTDYLKCIRGSPFDTGLFDRLAFYCPIVSALAAGAAEVVSGRIESWAFWIGLLSAVLSWMGVLATNKSSKLRDKQISDLIETQLRHGKNIDLLTSNF